MRSSPEQEVNNLILNLRNLQMYVSLMIYYNVIIVVNYSTRLILLYLVRHVNTRKCLAQIAKVKRAIYTGSRQYKDRVQNQEAEGNQ
jgi:hypothetical protein